MTASSTRGGERRCPAAARSISTHRSTRSATWTSAVSTRRRLLSRQRPTPTPGPYDGLQFQLVAPATVVEGSTLSYDVTVTNPTDADVALSPCPTWSEVIAVVSDPSPQTISGPFDCTATPSVRAHSSISIPMVITVPEAVGMAKFVWWFDGTPSAAVELLTVDGS